MTEIIINKSITPNKVVNLYNKYIILSDLGDVILVIPGEVKKYSFGLLSELLKFVINLHKSSKIHTLKLDVTKEELPNVYHQEYAYPLISLLWNTSQFVDRNDNNIKDLLREYQNDFFITMNSLSKIWGNQYILSNTDHLSKGKGLVRLLENETGFNDDEDLIIKNIKKILQTHVLSFSKSVKNQIVDDLDIIGAIVYELVKNTYEWGKTDSNLVDIESSIRGVYFRFHVNKIATIIKEYDNTPLKTYFNHKYISEECTHENENIYYLEILVYDSGVGFIDRFYPKQNLSDIDIIKKCLVKNQTSSTSNLKTKKGKGLDRILNILDKKGFFRISTDKYCVYRDLIKDKYTPIDNENLEKLTLGDWNSNEFNSVGVVKSHGSFVNILYPFKAIK